jgi:hypothetical protein
VVLAETGKSPSAWIRDRSNWPPVNSAPPTSSGRRYAGPQSRASAVVEKVFQVRLRPPPRRFNELISWRFARTKPAFLYSAPTNNR